VTATLPQQVQNVFARFATATLTTVEAGGRPAIASVEARYSPGDPCIDVSARAADPKVALLFCEPAGSGLEGAPQVLVQGTAQAGEGDLLRVRPERVYVWPEGDPAREPELFDAHIEEVQSGHVEEPAAELPPAEGGPAAWGSWVEELGKGDGTAVLSLVAPDGFPFSVRLPIDVDAERRCIRLVAGALGVPVQPGLACLGAGEGLRLSGDLVEDERGWAVIPH
jgi:Pyridoxamine 5'-phosphate oxidase